MQLTGPGLSNHANDLWKNENFTEREALLTTAEQITQTGSWVWDFQKSRVDWSDGMFRILGLSPDEDEATVDGFDRAIHPDDWCPFVAARQKIIESGQGGIVEVRVVRPNGDVRNVLLNVVVFADGNGNHVRSVGTALDITERKNLEIQLQQANKLELVGQIAGGVAHDFNNILTGILGYSEILENIHQEGGMADLAEMAGHIRKAAENAAGVTSRLMTFVRKQPLNRVPCDVHDVIHETIAILRTAISPDVKVSLNATAGSARVLGEVSHLQSALLNLGLNARDAINGKGQIGFSTAMEYLDAESAESLLCSCPSGYYLHVSVTDDGAGMSEQTKRRLFEPFFTTKAKGTGTGLGLISVRQTMQDHAGGIDIESVEGRGSRFSLYLPLIQVEQTPEVNIASIEGTGRILVVDDDQAVRSLLQTALTMAGFEVHTEADGQAGLITFTQDSESFDVIVLDIIMPGQNGWELLQQIRRVASDIPVLIISGFTGEISFERVISEGGTSFLPKPFRTRNLIAEVAKLIRKRSAVTRD